MRVLTVLALLAWAADGSGPRPRPRLYERVRWWQRAVRALL